MAENFANDIATVLASPMLAGDLTCTVASAIGFPAANFRIRIDNEIMLVTGVVGNVFTLTRAVEACAGTQVAQAHATTAAVQHVWTAVAIGNLGSGGGVPTGSEMDFTGTAAPSGWLLVNGQAVSRATFTTLFAVVTFTQAPTLTNGSAVIPFADTTPFYVGMTLTGTGVAAPVTFTASMTAGATTLTSVSSTVGLAAGMILYGPGLPANGVHLKTVGTTSQLGIWQPTLNSTTALQQLAYTEQSYYNTQTLTTQTYTAVPAVKSISANTSVTMSNVATANGVQTLTFYPHGAADGATLFHVPDATGRVSLGAGQHLSNLYPGQAPGSQAGAWPNRLPLGFASDQGIAISNDGLTTGGNGSNGADFPIPIGINCNLIPTFPPFRAINRIIKT